MLLNVELDSPSPDEPPRVTVRGARPLDEVKSGSRMLLTMDVTSADAIAELKLALEIGTPGHGEVQVRLKIGGESEPLLRLGRDYRLDGELAERLAEIEGLENVALATQRGGGHLRLVA